MSNLLLRHATVLDPVTGEYEQTDLRIADGLVVERGPNLTAVDVEALDLDGHYVLPGLIDCHVHVLAAVADLGRLRTWPRSYLAHRCGALMSAMLDRGFTTVRDMAGADHGIARAQAEGLLRGPRLFFAGQALSQTGGHGDDREPDDQHSWTTGLSVVVDGVDAVRTAARQQLRTGAHHLKVMASGGVASPTDRIDSTQFSLDELRAVVEEATAANRYVAAHAYDVRSVTRALEAGVRSIEHGNLIDAATATLIRDRGAFLVMNLVTYEALRDEGPAAGLPDASWRKVADVLDAGYRALDHAVAAGTPLAYGTDLLGSMQAHQSREFVIRGEVQPALDVIRGATTVAARLLRDPDRLGTLRPGAFGDLVVLDTDPLARVGVLAEPARMPYVVQGGRVVLRR